MPSKIELTGFCASSCADDQGSYAVRSCIYSGHRRQRRAYGRVPMPSGRLEISTLVLTGALTTICNAAQTGACTCLQVVSRRRCRRMSGRMRFLFANSDSRVVPLHARRLRAAVRGDPSSHEVHVDVEKMPFRKRTAHKIELLVSYAPSSSALGGGSVLFDLACVLQLLCLRAHGTARHIKCAFTHLNGSRCLRGRLVGCLPDRSGPFESCTRGREGGPSCVHES